MWCGQMRLEMRKMQEDNTALKAMVGWHGMLVSGEEKNKDDDPNPAG